MKPPFQGLLLGQDGRIWVQVPRPSARVPSDEIEQGEGPNPRPPTLWRAPNAFDVFEPDGTYLGAVEVPNGFSINPFPVLDGDRIWATVRGEFGEQYVVRYRIRVAGG